MSVFNVSTVSQSASCTLYNSPVVSYRTLNLISLLLPPFFDPLGPVFIKSLLRVTLVWEFPLLLCFTEFNTMDVVEELLFETLALEPCRLSRITPLLSRGIGGGMSSRSSVSISIRLVSNSEES